MSSPQLDDDRCLSTNMMPDYGAYVVFTLDAVATLETLEDPEATAQARALPTRKYVGHVSRVVDLPHPERRYHRCSCVFLSQGLPETNPAKCVDESMCVAIAPATHPAGRASVTPSPPLPWDNLYHHAEHGMTLRLVTHDEIDHSSSPGLTTEDIVHVMLSLSEDSLRIQEQRRLEARLHPQDVSPPPVFPAYPQPSPLPVAVPPVSPRAEHDELTTGVDTSSGSSSSMSDMESHYTFDSMELMFTHAAACTDENPLYQFLPVLDYTTDLSIVTEFTDARHLFEEFEELKRIRVESVERSQLRMIQLDGARLGRETLETATKESDSTPLPAESSVSAGCHIPIISHVFKKFRTKAQRKQSLLRGKEAGTFLADNGSDRQTSGRWKHAIYQVVSFATGGCME